MSNIKTRYRQIERGEIKDDFSNHFYSHFGFYDEPFSDYSYSKYYNTPYDIQTGTTLNSAT